jgi:hypothetical protein
MEKWPAKCKAIAEKIPAKIKDRGMNRRAKKRSPNYLDIHKSRTGGKLLRSRTSLL